MKKIARTAFVLMCLLMAFSIGYSQETPVARKSPLSNYSSVPKKASPFSNIPLLNPDGSPTDEFTRAKRSEFGERLGWSPASDEGLFKETSKGWVRGNVQLLGSVANTLGIDELQSLANNYLATNRQLFDSERKSVLSYIGNEAGAQIAGNLFLLAAKIRVVDSGARATVSIVIFLVICFMVALLAKVMKQRWWAWFLVSLFLAPLVAFIGLIIVFVTSGQLRRIAHTVKQGTQSIFDSSKERLSGEKPMVDRDKELYTKAGSEVASKTYDPGLFAKAFSESDGDEKKAQAIYIRCRVNELRQQRKKSEEVAEEQR